MKNQYFGDIGDYGKYGLLKFLGERDVKIAVNWYLTKNDQNKSGDGGFIDYLKEKKNQAKQRYDINAFIDEIYNEYLKYLYYYNYNPRKVRKLFSMIKSSLT